MGVGWRAREWSAARTVIGGRGVGVSVGAEEERQYEESREVRMGRREAMGVEGPWGAGLERLGRIWLVDEIRMERLHGRVESLCRTLDLRWEAEVLRRWRTPGIVCRK